MSVMKASDLLKAADTHANRPAATAVPVGGLYSCTTHNLIYRSDGAAWSTWATLGGGGAKAFKRAKRTSGDITITSTTFVDIDSGLDLVMNAAVGDVVELTLGAKIRLTATSGSTYAVFDFHTIVSSSPVNSVSADGAAGTGLSNSFPGWASGQVQPDGVGVGPAVMTGTKRYTVVSGDLSSGAITLRLRAFVGASCVLRASDPMLYVQAINLGPQPA